MSRMSFYFVPLTQRYSLLTITKKPKNNHKALQVKITLKNDLERSLWFRLAQKTSTLPQRTTMRT